MKQIVFGESVQGASHKRVNMECQDTFKKLEYDDGTVIMAIADGHGSRACPHSKSGSSIAVNVFCKVMGEFYANYAENLEMLLTYLNREGDTKVAQEIDAEWKRRVLKVHTKQKREVPLTETGEKNKAEIYKQYGSTLVGMMITPIFIFAFQLGDGDISIVSRNGLNHLLEGEKILGVETHSLSKIDSWKRAVSVVRRRTADSGFPYMLMLSTDGFANSYKSVDDFQKTCLGQHRTILRVEARRPVFWQVKQKAQRILCVFASIFVTVAGKSASEATLKASAVNCAVLP